MMIVFNILRFFLMGHHSSRGNYGHPRHCNCFQVVAAQLRLLIQQQLAVEHRQSGIEVCGCSLAIQCAIFYEENMHMNWISEDFLHPLYTQICVTDASSSIYIHKI